MRDGSDGSGVVFTVVAGFFFFFGLRNNLFYDFRIIKKKKKKLRSFCEGVYGSHSRAMDRMVTLKTKL